MAKSKLKDKFKGENNTLVTDTHNAYSRIMYGTGVKHETIKADKHRKGKYNLAKVNSIHSCLDAYMDSHQGRVYSTKYLDLNLMLFWWLFKYREYSSEEKAQALYKIMTDEIPDIETRERVNQITEEELVHREISIDTKGNFPTKL